MGELERIGESDGLGWMLLELLERNGWTVHVRPAFAGGILVVGSHPRLGFEVKCDGPRVADAAVPFFLECARWLSLSDPQIRLAIPA